MRDPNPINLTDDNYWRSLGWPAVARDADGHVISTCDDSSPEIFKDWLLECFEDGLTVTNLRRSAPGISATLRALEAQESEG